MGKVHARSHEMTNKPLRVRTTKTLWLPSWKTNCNDEKCASDVKKKKNRRTHNFEGEANNMQLDKEDTRRSNYNSKCVFNILILLFVFMFNKLTCKVRFHIALWSLSKSIRASSFIENFPQISAKAIAFQRNLLGKLPIVFSETRLENSREIPAKSAVFSANLPLKIPRNLTFFSATYQKPCIY